MPESSDSMYSSILMLENIWYHHFTWSVSNSQEIGNLFEVSPSPRGPTNGKKTHNLREFGPLQVKWWYHMFSSIKREEYVEFEISGIFWVKLVAKNIVLGSLVTLHQAVLVVWCLFLKKRTHFMNQTVTLKYSLAKQYTSLNYVKEMSFCLVNWAFSLVGPWGPISCGKVAKIFHAYEG